MPPPEGGLGRGRGPGVRKCSAPLPPPPSARPDDMLLSLWSLEAGRASRGSPSDRFVWRRQCRIAGRRAEHCVCCLIVLQTSC